MGTPAAYVGIRPSNTGAQNSAAWDALMAAMSNTASLHLEFDSGTYSWSRQIDVIRKVKISGQGGGPHSPGTFFSFPKNVHGIYFHSYATYTGVPGGNRADGALIEDLRIQATAKEQIRHAIVMKAPVTIRNVYCENWAGDGLHINAGLVASPPSSVSSASVHRLSVANCGRVIPVTSVTRASNVVTVVCATPHFFEATAPNETIFWLNNTNSTYCLPLPTYDYDGFRLGVKGGIFNIVDATTFQYNEVGANGTSSTGWEVRTGNGAYIHGGDANACDFTGISVTGCKCWAVFEDSQLGNLHQGHHCDSVELGAYYADQGNCYSSWIGCYSEQNCPCSYLNAPSVVLGGDQGATPLGDAYRIGPYGIENMAATLKDASGLVVGTLDLGNQASGTQSYMRFNVQGSVHSQYIMKNSYNFFWNGWAGNWIGWGYGTGANAAFMVALDSAVAPNGRTVDGGTIALRDGFLMPNGSFWTEANAAPTTGKWWCGDRIWHNTPTVGQPQGWVCTVSGDFAGTPPTFVAMANL